MGSSKAKKSIERRVVIVLTDHEYEKCEYEQGAGVMFVTPGVRVLRYPSDSNDWFAIHLEKRRLYYPGTILLQSPYNGMIYRQIEESNIAFAQEKFKHFFSICQLLGASRMSVERIELFEENSKNEWEIKSKINCLSSTEIKIDGETGSLYRLRNSLGLAATLEGGDSNPAEAMKYANKFNLIGDIELESLIELRSRSNRIKEWRKVINLSHEAESSLAFAASVKVPGFLSISGKYSQAMSVRREYMLTTKVTFN